MGARAPVSPGGALLRTSRMFSIPKPLPDYTIDGMPVGERRARAQTMPYPRHQSITSPLSSREKGDWGFKRAFPPKTTMTTSTPYIRVKEVDTAESVTDFHSAADHTLSREKFHEMGIAMSVPMQTDRRGMATRTETHLRSVFEEGSDVTHFTEASGTEGRWKFNGPWLGNLNEGDFLQYVDKYVRPRRREFTELLRKMLAEEMFAQQSKSAQDRGEAPPAKIEPRDLTAAQFNDYLRTLRHDRVTLNAIVTKFLDLAPLGRPVGIIQTFWGGQNGEAKESPYRRAGPPPSHPSAGMSYLRTGSYMENHPVYGPQAKKSPTLARVVSPRIGSQNAKMGVGGFITDTPVGDNAFNVRYGRDRALGGKAAELKGVSHLDIKTYGGAKAYVEPHTASVDSTGWIHIKLKGTSTEAEVIANEAKGKSTVYNNFGGTRIGSKGSNASKSGRPDRASKRLNQIADEMVGEEPEAPPTKRTVGSSESYGLDPSGR